MGFKQIIFCKGKEVKYISIIIYFKNDPNGEGSMKNARKFRSTFLNWVMSQSINAINLINHQGLPKFGIQKAKKKKKSAYSSSCCRMCE